MRLSDAGLTAVLALPTAGAALYGVGLLRTIRRDADGERGTPLRATVARGANTPQQSGVAPERTTEAGRPSRDDAHLEVLYRAYTHTVWRAQLSYGTGQFMAIAATVLVLVAATVSFFDDRPPDAADTVLRSLLTVVIAAVSGLLFRESRQAHRDLRDQVAAIREEVRVIENHRLAFRALEKTAGEEASATAAQMALVLLGGPWVVASEAAAPVPTAASPSS